MTPEQEALRDRERVYEHARESLRRTPHLWPVTDPDTLNAAARVVTDDIFAAIPGLRVVGDDEVVVKRSSIREGWARVDRGGVAYFLVADGHTDTNQERVGVISPWPPEDAS